MFGGNADLFAIIKYFSFAFFLFIPFATQLFSTQVTPSNLRNQAPLFMELRLLQGTKLYVIHSANVKMTTSDVTNVYVVGYILRFLQIQYRPI